MQNRFRRPRGDPPRRGHKCALRPPNAVIWYESATFAQLKNKSPKKWQKWKNVFEKVSLTTVTHFRPPRGGLLEKRVPKRAQRTSEKRGFQKWAFRLDETRQKYRMPVNYNGFERKTWWEKKLKKVKKNDNFPKVWTIFSNFQKWQRLSPIFVFVRIKKFVPQGLNFLSNNFLIIV